MPTARHDVIIHDFINLILSKVAALARSFEQDFPAISQRLLKLRTFSITDVNLLSGEKSGHKSPDVSIGYSDRVYPHVVFETSYSQARKPLNSLAWSYIMESSHSVRCVVGLDADLSRESSSPSAGAYNVLVSVWRPLVEIEQDIENMDVKQEVTNQPLGECDPDHAIAVLCIRDLLDDEMLATTSPEIAECEIVVTSREMIDIMKEAELIQETQLRETQTASDKRQDPNRTWRKRHITPGEG